MNVESHHTTKELQTLYRTEKIARLAQSVMLQSELDIS